MKSVSSRDTNLGIIVEAKQQYTKQLMNIMKPIIYEELFDMYTKSVEVCEDPSDLLICFQNELKQVPKWNSDVIKEATKKILDTCSYFNDLITAVFLSNVRILTSVKLGSKKRQVKLVVPTNETFVHKVYVNVSKSIYNDPFTFSNKRYNGNVLRNMNDVYPLIETSIEDTIRDMLPIQSILESYLGDTMDNSDTESTVSTVANEPESDTEDQDATAAAMEESDTDNEEPETENEPEPITETEPLPAETTKPFTGDGFFAKPPTSPVVEQVKDIPIGKPCAEVQKRPETEPTKRPQSFFDDVEDY